MQILGLYEKPSHQHEQEQHSDLQDIISLSFVRS